MHDLVVTLLEFAINVNVLDVEAGQMLKNFVVGPRLDIRDSLFVFLSWHMLDLNLLLQVIHRVTQH